MIKLFLFLNLLLIKPSAATDETKGYIETSPSSAIFSEHERMDISPPFYHVSKADKSFYLLGTLHDCPISLLPSEIPATIFQCSTLICERCPHEEIYDGLRRRYYSEDSNWFSTLDETAQAMLHGFFKEGTDTFERFSWILPDFKIDIGIMAFILVQVDFSEGMDKKIQKRFRESEKEIVGLDEDSHILATFEPYKAGEPHSVLKELRDTYEEFKSLDDLRIIRNLIFSANNTKEASKERRHADQSKQHYIQEYLSGKDLRSCDGEPIFEEETIRWCEKLFTLIEQGTINALGNACIAIGKDHCNGNSGFLKYAMDQGWEVKKYPFEH